MGFARFLQYPGDLPLRLTYCGGVRRCLMRKRRVLIAALAAAALVVLAIVGVAAQSPSSSGETPSAITFLSRLVANLGIGEDQLRSAIKTTAGEEIDAALQDGKLTQEQVDRFKQRLAADDGAGMGALKRAFGSRHPRPIHHMQRAGAHIIGLVADLFGTERQDVFSELRAGKSLAQLAQEHGIGEDQLKQVILDNAEQSLGQALANGRITADQKDAKLSQLSSHLDVLIHAIRRMKQPLAPSLTP